MDLILRLAFWVRKKFGTSSLKPTLARFLMHMPPGHKGRIASSWRAEWLDLSPHWRGAMIKAAMFALFGIHHLAIPSTGDERHDDSILWEGAVVSLLILLYSPLTWRQHCVAVVPAFYLIARTQTARGARPGGCVYALGIYVILVLVFDRGVVGRDVTLILDSWGATTWSILLLLAVTLGCHARQVIIDELSLSRMGHARFRGLAHVAWGQSRRPYTDPRRRSRRHDDSAR